MKRWIVVTGKSRLAVVLTSGAVAAGVDDGDQKAVAKGNTAFALDLYAKLRAQEGNLFLSPYSISTALAMTYAGARGETEKQMAQVLHFDLPQEKLHPAFKALIAATKADRQKDGLELHVANALWGQKGFTFLDPFLTVTRANYGAGLRELDFVRQTEAARLTINRWVEQQTRDKIKDLIKQGVLNADTRLVLTNAIYFLGDWQSPFKKRATRDSPFTLINGDQIKVPTMHQMTRFGYTESDDLQVLEMPYKSGKAAMVVLLPKKKDGLPALEKALNAAALAGWLEGLQRQQVAVSLPKVETTCAFELKPTLGAMGMPDAFSAREADFSGTTCRRDLFISNVIHKAFVRVDEKGTEAAAATAVVMELTAAPMRPVVFNADHPFLFLLRDNRSGSILFIGRVMDPRK